MTDEEKERVDFILDHLYEQTKNEKIKWKYRVVNYYIDRVEYYESGNYVCNVSIHKSEVHKNYQLWFETKDYAEPIFVSKKIFNKTFWKLRRLYKLVEKKCGKVAPKKMKDLEKLYEECLTEKLAGL